jgi:hypothetical protein
MLSQQPSWTGCRKWRSDDVLDDVLREGGYLRGRQSFGPMAIHTYRGYLVCKIMVRQRRSEADDSLGYQLCGLG